MIPPKWINATDINQWADRRISQEMLPQLLRRLINASVDVQKIAFPAGDSVQMGGWDGIVKTIESNVFVPNGYSVWELGTNKGIKGKADKDYSKRSKNSLGLDKSQTTFIFVTPRRWGTKDKWINEKNAEGIWGEVKVYDADDLEQWLELSPTVHIWFAQLLGKWFDDTQDLDSFWNEWINTTLPPLTSALHLAGREESVEKVKNWLIESPSKLTIKGESLEEAVAFFAAIIVTMPEDEGIRYLSRCVLIKSESLWRYFCNIDGSLILIPIFDKPKFIPQSHHVLFPVGREISLSVLFPMGRKISPSQEPLTLSRLSQKDFTESLVNMGLSERQADVLSKESKQNLQVLCRLLVSDLEIKVPNWSAPENARSLIPIILVGQWNTDNENDRKVIAKLANKSYEQVINDLSSWLNTSDSPIRKVDNMWQLWSLEVSWHFLSPFLIDEDLQVFEEVILSVLGELDPKYQLPIEQQFAHRIYGKELLHSNCLREGLADTLAILSTKGLVSKSQYLVTSKNRVNTIVYKLLNTNDSEGLLWHSLSSLLPTLAEAAPEVFIDVLQTDLTSETPRSLGLFQETSTGGSCHIHLLWALESLAWETNYVSQVCLILAKLSRLDLGGKILNRPFNSLREIFQCWKPQTSASLDDRLEIIDNLLIREPAIAWKLLLSLLPKVSGEISHPIYKPRWQNWQTDYDVKVTWFEYEKNIDSLIRLIISNVFCLSPANAGNSVTRLCDLINNISSLPSNFRESVVDFIYSMDTTKIKDTDRVQVWNTLRNIIWEHKRYLRTKWAMRTEIVNKLESVYHQFEPKNFIDRYAWLFCYNPQLFDTFILNDKKKCETVKQTQLEIPTEMDTEYNIEDLIKENVDLDWERKDKIVKKYQLDIATKIYQEFGIAGLLEIVIHVPEPDLFGVAMAKIKPIEAEEVDLLKKSLGEEKKPLNDLARGFIRIRLEVLGWNWVETFIKSHKLSKKQLIIFFHALPFQQHSWNLLSLFDDEIEQIYWETVSPSWVSLDDCETAVKKLLSVNRSDVALNLVSLYLHSDPNAVESQTLVEILENLARFDSLPQTSPVNVQCLDYYIDKIFQILDISESITKNKILDLEWMYFYVLRHTERQPKLLFQEISKNPSLFAELITLIYRSENENDSDNYDEFTDSEKIIAFRSKVAYELLEAWRQVPGLTEKGQINCLELKKWVSTARSICHQNGRGKIGDIEIGKVLAYAPKSDDGIYPDVTIREIIENIESRELEQGIEVGIYNKRGAWIKSIGEGGIQEEKLAQTYSNYANAIRSRYPRTASMLDRIAHSYNSDAHKEDITSELND